MRARSSGCGAGLAAEVDPVGLAESVAGLAGLAESAAGLAAGLGDAVNVALGLVAPVAPAVSVRSGHSDRNERRSG